MTDEMTRAIEALAAEAEATAVMGKYVARDIRAHNLSPDNDRAIRAMLAFAAAERAAAVAQERERCAKVAEMTSIAVPLQPGCPDGANLARRQIAAAIREGAGA